jgi:hypothetical protein
MANLPTLKITYDSDNFPVSARCSACGQEMPEGDLRRTFKRGNLEWFKVHFDLHRKLKHSHEDAK